MTVGNDTPQPCDLCGRVGEALTRHHLIPRTRHTNRRNQRDFDRRDVRTRIAMLCRPCHSHIHAVLTTKQLEREFNTLEALRQHPDVRKFVAFIKRQPAGSRIAVRTSSAKRDALNAGRRNRT